MALILDFEVCMSSDCKTLTFVETTGAYDVTSNPTGWGTPNATLAGATTAVLTIVLASGNSYSLDLFALSDFPTSDITFQYELVNSGFGYTVGSSIDDQIINFTYSVTTGDATYTQNKQYPFYCQVQCCVMGMFKNLNVECDSCTEQTTKALQAYAMLKGLIANANCGNKTNFNNILVQLNKLCLNSSCSNCK